MCECMTDRSCPWHADRKTEALQRIAARRLELLKVLHVQAAERIIKEDTNGE